MTMQEPVMLQEITLRLHPEILLRLTEQLKYRNEINQISQMLLSSKTSTYKQPVEITLTAYITDQISAVARDADKLASLISYRNQQITQLEHCRCCEG
jgi:hypothetical protein